MGLAFGTAPDSWGVWLPKLRPRLRRQAREICESVSALGGSYLVHIPDTYREEDGSSAVPGHRASLESEDIDFPTAINLGVMCEPQDGTVDFTGLDAIMRQVEWGGHSAPLPIATRTRRYFSRLGWSA